MGSPPEQTVSFIKSLNIQLYWNHNGNAIAIVTFRPYILSQSCFSDGKARRWCTTRLAAKAARRGIGNHNEAPFDSTEMDMLWEGSRAKTYNKLDETLMDV